MGARAMNRNSFLHHCQISTQSAYEAFKWLLSQFEDPLTRKETILFWNTLTKDLKTHFSSTDMMSRYHFSLLNLNFSLEGHDLIKLDLLQLPSTFAPEAWSFTFFEGLARYPILEFQDKVIAELGCGIGWISLALGKQARVAKIYGLDINPKAILCSRINLFLNAFDEKGDILVQDEGRTLLDRVEFHDSNLLDYCRTRRIFLDRVIGCIPQVLSPDPEFSVRVQAHLGLNKIFQNDFEQANDEFLFSLSNYTSDQGYIEDQFGLGLIARAVEESVDVLRVAGKIILNLGGRPGSRVLQRLFLRRGFTMTVRWRTRVKQAKDTDIRSLVSIEMDTNHRFEFFMGQGSDTPVSAKTALAYAECGGEIYHELGVYEIKLRDSQLPKVLQFIRQTNFQEVRNSIDLGYSEDALVAEKVSYLNALIEYFQEVGNFRYGETIGVQKFRERIGLFFKKYYKIQLESSSIFIFPSVVALCRTILNVFHQDSGQRIKILVDAQLSKSLNTQFEVLELPRSSDLLCDLMEKLNPKIVIYSMPASEAISKDSFLRICETAEKCATRIFIDISELIELSSSPKNNAIFRYLVENSLQSHVSLICGLVKNKLYNDLEVCFLISENKSLIQWLKSSAEFVYGSTSVLTQLYYDRIFQELINFQIMGVQIEKINKIKIPVIAPSLLDRKYLQPNQLNSSHYSDNDSFTKFDFGENNLNSPKCLSKIIFESFAKMQISTEESDCYQEVIEVLKSRIILDNSIQLKVIFGCGVLPIFFKIAENCSKSGTSMIFPALGYSHFISSAQFLGVQVRIVHSQRLNYFKISADELEDLIRSIPIGQACVFMSGPLADSTGAFYTAKELHDIFSVIQNHQSTLVLDTSLSDLEFDSLKQFELINLSKFKKLKWMILGGISKEFAAGGLRVGYAVLENEKIYADLNHGQSIAIPHRTLKYTLKRIYQELIRRDNDLLFELEQQRLELKARVQLLSAVLLDAYWDPLPSSGGLFLCATPGDLIKDRDIESFIKNEMKELAHPPKWAGLEKYYRFLISVDDAEFQALIRILKQFKISLGF